MATTIIQDTNLPKQCIVDTKTLKCNPFSQDTLRLRAYGEGRTACHEETPFAYLQAANKFFLLHQTVVKKHTESSSASTISKTRVSNHMTRGSTSMTIKEHVQFSPINTVTKGK